MALLTARDPGNESKQVKTRGAGTSAATRPHLGTLVIRKRHVNSPQGRESSLLNLL